MEVFVNNSIAPICKLIVATPRYIILQYNVTLLVNVYLPCRSTVDPEEMFIDCLASIMQDVSELQYAYIVFRGDKNIELTETSTLSAILSNFVQDLGLNFLNDKLPIDGRNTFILQV